MQLARAASAQSSPFAVSDPNPARDFIVAYDHALYAIPGVTNLAYFPTTGDKVVISFRTEALRQVGEMILEDVVNGVQLVTKVVDWTGGSPAPDDSLWKHQQAIASIAALPGVWDERTNSGPWTGNGEVTFHAINQRVVDHLDPIIRDTIEGQRRSDGSVRHYAVRWRVDAGTSAS